jgi:sterol 3beta-glucosyltransferase
MRVVFFSYGTRGDAQPQVVLASGLRERGFQVRVAAPENLRGFVEASGVEYAPLFGNSQEILESDAGRKWLSSGDVQAFMKGVAGIMAKINPELFKTAAAAAEGADAIVGGTLMEDVAFTIAEKRKVPLIFAHTIPLEMTGEYPSPLVTRARLPLSFLNRLTHALLRKLAWQTNRDTLNPYRQSLGLEPMAKSIVGGAHEHKGTVLQRWSEHVLPHPADAARDVVTSGYIRMPPAVRARLGEAIPPATLVNWLGSGPPPVYLGFGSMPVIDPLATAQQVLDVATELDVRVVLSAGWTDVTSALHLESNRVHFVRNVDHGWLLPRCAAAVHHGGAGTTAASLEAGLPTVIFSVFADQPFWGERVRRLGVGDHVPYAKLTRKTLAATLRTAFRADVRQRAAELGDRLRREDGTTATVDAIVNRLGASGQSAAA